MKIRPLRAYLFHAKDTQDGRMVGQTDMTKLTVAFRNFAKALKILRSAHKGAFVCSVWISAKTPAISLHHINWWV
jgi:hypothetical protein